MIDPRHGRRIPSGTRFARVLARIFRHNFDDSRQMIELGYRPDLGRMQRQIYDVALRALAIEIVSGYLRTKRRTTKKIASWVGSVRWIGDGKYYRVKAIGDEFPPPPIPQPTQFGFIDWSVFRPEVRVAAEQAALRLAGTVIEDTKRMIREELGAGLSAGEPVAAIAERIRLSGFSPRRAVLIAQTESSRAMHAGQAVAARELGVTQWSWLASSDACPICLQLDGKVVDIGAPFYVWPTGNPAYRVVYHAPAHPNCYCTNMEVMPE